MALKAAGEELARLSKSGRTDVELAFFGGTFTFLPEKDQGRCLAFYAHWREQGVLNGLRCSTRPDAVSPERLDVLQKGGMTTVELGVQSFSSMALRAAGRGYDEEIARKACAQVKEAGLQLGLQLMPGMPGVDRPVAENDLAIAVEMAPQWLRLYPCLVLAGTALEALCRQGRFSPWSLESTVAFLAEACLMAWGAGIRLIRLGLAPGAGLLDGLLDGPWHASLGSMVRGTALAGYVEQQLREAGVERAKERELELRLSVPRRFQGEFWGHKAGLAERYAGMGLGRKNVAWHDGDDFLLEWDWPSGGEE